MTNKKSIFKSVAVVTAYSVATTLFAFLFKVFVSRQFGASVVGVYQMALSFYFYVSAVALSGLPTVISRKIAEDEKTGGKQPFRTYNGMKYQGGYSDHLPIYTDFYIKEIE